MLYFCSAFYPSTGKGLQVNQTPGRKRPFQKIGVNDLGYRVGESHHRAKLADIDIEMILYLREAKLSFSQIAAKFDDGLVISKSTVRDVCSGRIRGQQATRWKKGG
jgi:hypothetical protein